MGRVTVHLDVGAGKGTVAFWADRSISPIVMTQLPGGLRFSDS